MNSQRSLAEWIAYIQTLHHRDIDMSLDRVECVYRNLAPNGIPFKVCSIAGTNGKGSTAALLASIYRAGGYRVGKYTSPHLVRFNERININGEAVSDAPLLASFERIESLRGGVPLTFFEFTTLVALDLFLASNVDVAIMEVGLGGRLDAVNVLDADVAAITNISLDHTAWLGDTIVEIAMEKSGIARAERPCVVGTHEAPVSLLDACRSRGAELAVLGSQFTHEKATSGGWAFASSGQVITGLPFPFDQAGVQLDNAALALKVSECLSDVLPLNVADIRSGLASATLAGRCHIIQQSPLVILDVAHNEASIDRLADFVKSCEVVGNVVAVCGMLKDKEIADSLKKIVSLVDTWQLATIAGERGSDSQDLFDILTHELNVSQSKVICYEQVERAYDDAFRSLSANDCLLVFGSFYIVGDILRLLDMN